MQDYTDGATVDWDLVSDLSEFFDTLCSNIVYSDQYENATAIQAKLKIR